MVLFFFYNKFTKCENLNKISLNYKIIDGHIMINDFCLENNIIKINKDIGNNDNGTNDNDNNKILSGKIIEFNESFDYIINKINTIYFDLSSNDDLTNTKYDVEKIKSFDKNGKYYDTYIIYNSFN